MNDNIQQFGRLLDGGTTGDRKRSFINSDSEDEYEAIAMEIDTDDHDRQHAERFKAALLALWNSQTSDEAKALEFRLENARKLEVENVQLREEIERLKSRSVCPETWCQ